MTEPSPVAALFDSLADSYDAQGVEFFGPIARGLVEQLDPQAGERALDIGCGKGAVLAPLVASGAHTVGIDIAPRMVELAHALVPSAEVPSPTGV